MQPYLVPLCVVAERENGKNGSATASGQIRTFTDCYRQ